MNQSKTTTKTGIIGGSGVLTLKGLEITKREVVHTPYGEPSGAFTTGKLFGHEVIFLARHGHGHQIPPHRINYRANIWAFQHLGISNIIAFAAVGAINAAIPTATVVIPDQIIDYTYNRSQTFFEKDLSSVTHIDFSQPYCTDLRNQLVAAAEQAGIKITDTAVYAATQGPRLETAAEINRLERDGCDIVGMTGMPEASLARELDLCYAALAIVANPAAGRGAKEILLADIELQLVKGTQSAIKILEQLLS